MKQGKLDDIVRYLIETKNDNSNRFLIIKSRFNTGKLSELTKKSLVKKYGYKMVCEAIYEKK